MSLADSLRILLEHGLLEGGEAVSYSGEWALFRVGWREGRPCLTTVSGLYLGWAGGRGGRVLQQ